MALLNEKKKSKKGFFLVVMGIVLFFSILPSLSNSRSKASPTIKQEVIHNEWDSSVIPVKTWLSMNAKDPSSIQYLEWSSVQKIDNIFVVRCKYRAKNSFGALVVENKVFAFDLKGDLLSFKDF